MESILDFIAKHGISTLLCLVLIFRIEKAIYKLRDSIDELKDTIIHSVVAKGKDSHEQTQQTQANIKSA